MYVLGRAKVSARLTAAAAAAGAPAAKIGRCRGVLRALATSRVPEKTPSGDKEAGLLRLHCL